MYRQGDILLIPATIPAGATAGESTGRHILAYGEVTGHHHSVAVADADLLTVDGTAEAAERFLRVHRETTLDHQEHGALLIPPGEYIIRRQREYQPRELPRYVVD